MAISILVSSSVTSQVYNHHDVASNAVEVSCMSRMDAYNHVWETMALLALVREVANKNHQTSRCVVLVEEIRLMMVVVVEVWANGDDLVIEGDV